MYTQPSGFKNRGSREKPTHPKESKRCQRRKGVLDALKRARKKSKLRPDWEENCGDRSGKEKALCRQSVKMFEGHSLAVA